jgi:hypothetical protein
MPVTCIPKTFALHSELARNLCPKLPADNQRAYDPIVDNTLGSSSLGMSAYVQLLNNPNGIEARLSPVLALFYTLCPILYEQTGLMKPQCGLEPKLSRLSVLQREQ